MHQPDYNAHVILGATTSSSLISADVAISNQRVYRIVSCRKDQRAQGFTIQLKRTWSCKFHVQALGCVKRERRREEERINKSALKAKYDARVNSEVIAASLIAVFYVENAPQL